MTRPLISVLLPTRGRVSNLRQSLDSLVSLVKDQTNLEIIFKVDDDDADTIAFCNWFVTVFPSKVITSPRGNGYHDMHLWMNEMAAQAEGEWLFIFNDDALMMTQDWDIVFRDTIQWCRNQLQESLDVSCFSILTHERPGAREFFFIPKKVYDILGCIARIPHVDTWFTTLMDIMGKSFVMSAIVAKHNSHIEDSVRKDSIPARETLEYTRKAIAFELRRAKIMDALKLQDYLEKYDVAPTPQQPQYRIVDADTSVFLKSFEFLPEGSKILEVGSRDEPIANMLADRGYDVWGVDLREYDPVCGTGVTEKPKCNYNYIRGDLCNLPLPVIAKHFGTFDCVVCISAIEHFGLGTYKDEYHPYYDVLGMKWIWYLLKDNGVCYLSVPFGGRYIENKPHWRIYNKREMITRLLSDFNVDKSAFFVADTIDIGGKTYSTKGETISPEVASSYMGNIPHISVLLKLTKNPINRVKED